jgi:hypothetical protein
MEMTTPTVKVKPWAPGQGEYVEINAADFDPAKFELYEQPKPKGRKAQQ